MKFILLLVAAICSVSGLPALNGRILNGGSKPATVGQFPYVVSITQSGSHFCSGFIYSSRFVITTASCLDGKTTNTLKVVAGQVSLVDQEPNEQILSVFSVTIFPDYDKITKANDVAIIKLTADIIFDGDATTPSNVNFIKYNEVDPTVLAATIMGWGVNIEGGVYESINLRYANVALNDPAGADATTCTGFDAFAFQSMICASATDTSVTDYGSPCHFDEGAPLVQSSLGGIPTVVGILSQIEKDCLTTAPSVYTRLSVYYYWFINVAGLQPSV